MYTKFQLFFIVGLLCGIYTVALWLFVVNPVWFLNIGFICTVYFFIVIFLAFFLNLVGVKFRDL